MRPTGDHRRAVERASLLRRFLVWLGSHELGFLLSLAALVAGFWLFALLADEVMEGGTAWIDRTILLGLRDPANLADPVGPPVVEEAARDVTALGGVTILTFLTLVIGGYLVLDGKRRLALFVWARLSGLASWGLRSVGSLP